MAQRIRRTPEFQRLQYRNRLSVLRHYYKRFDFRYDEKHLQKLDSETRRNLRSRVNRAYLLLHPFIARPHKDVLAPLNPIRLRALLKHAGMEHFRGLYRVPVPTYGRDSAKIRVDKKGAVQIRIGTYKEKTFFFPRRAKRSEDFVIMAEELLRTLPPGMYVLRTRRNILLHRMFERDFLVDEVAQFIASYGDKAGFVDDLLGVKWMGRSEDAAIRRQVTERKIRRDLKRTRKTVQEHARDIIREARAHKRKVSKAVPKKVVKRVVKKRVLKKPVLKKRVVKLTRKRVVKKRIVKKERVLGRKKKRVIARKKKVTRKHK